MKLKRKHLLESSELKLRKYERKDILESSELSLRKYDNIMTFELDFINSGDYIKYSLSISPNNDKMSKAFEDGNHFVLFEDRLYGLYGYRAFALGCTTYIDTDSQYINGIIHLYNTDIFIVNGEEVFRDDFVKTLKFDVGVPVSIYEV